VKTIAKILRQALKCLRVKNAAAYKADAMFPVRLRYLGKGFLIRAIRFYFRQFH